MKINSETCGQGFRTAQPVKLLVINCGSSSLKYHFFDAHDPVNNAHGVIERIGQEGTRHKYISGKGEKTFDMEKGDHSAAFKSMVAILTDVDSGMIKDLKEITAVGHRVVHGADKFSEPTLITAEVIAQIEALSHLAPLHNPLNVIGIKESMRFLPQAKQVAVFDTAFHHKMPAYAYLYGLPWEYYEKHGIRRYGFHGNSHHFVALKAAEYLERPFKEVKLITCHLGNGVSITAVDRGRSIDTSMGMTPTEGPIMGTRCGDMDPSVILYMQRELDLSADVIDDIINRRSGLKGISGISNDLREIEAAAEKGDKKAGLAIEIFCYRIRKYIGAYAAALGGTDALVFTGGIGEGSASVRARVCENLGFMGISLDLARNVNTAPGRGETVEISEKSSTIRVLVIPTEEESMIAMDILRAIGIEY